jgi:hypothetical protein
MTTQPTTAQLADALADLASTASARCLSNGGPVDGRLDPRTTAEIADQYETSAGMVWLAVDYFLKGRPQLEQVAALGLAENNEALLTLGSRYLARRARPVDRS